MLSQAEIKSFQELYSQKFGEELSEEEAYSQASKLIQMMKIVYKPMSENEYKKLADRRLITSKEDENEQKEQIKRLSPHA